MSKTITIDWPDAEWEALVEAGQRAVDRAFALFAEDFWGNLREEAPVDKGRLSGSFQLERVGAQSHRITSGVEYAMAQWKGLKPFTIRPKNKKALYWPGARHPVKYVNHPGISPNDYVGRALKRTEARGSDFITLALQEAGLA